MLRQWKRIQQHIRFGISASAISPDRDNAIYINSFKFVRLATWHHADMQTTINSNENLFRRRVRACLTAIAAASLTLCVQAGDPSREQALSVASTWQLPQEPKAVGFALSPDCESLALMRTNGDVEIWSTLTHELRRKVTAKATSRAFVRR